MLTNMLRENRYAAVILLFVRVYLGFQWIEAAWHKLTGGFDATGFLKNAVNKPIVDTATKELVYPNFTAFVNHFALPNVKLINIVIPIGELLIGLGLILGGLTAAAAFFGLLMNFMFMFAGTVNTNPWFILIGGIVFMAGANAGRYGLDYYLLPLLRKAVNHMKHKNIGGGTTTGTPAHA
ncbi:DoxX family membrane protein [Paenibacillus cremeus]|uniref:DoxX family membrane protein n=1 Tax=Paenibacillus cremeus TaxID=2163881 RepID=A0A559JGL8_9BACL|nr:DoxX family membrane protein [Paenibacillus cremeus]TVX99010.1 DoxX family membrane protein [Paenibacillus cremeus]